MSVAVGSVFPAGTALRDAYSGGTATVASDGTFTIGVDPSGVVLMEKADAVASAFDWHDVTVYNAMVDRFENGDPANDTSYGRGKTTSSRSAPGTAATGRGSRASSTTCPTSA